MKDFGKLLISVGGCFAVAGLGSALTLPSISTWYPTINKPPFTPPNWIFGPVWTILFLLIGIAAYLVWQKGLKKKGVKTALQIFVLQLVLNFLWSLFFFGLHLPGLALVDIIFLWLAIFITIRLFLKLSKKAAYLLLPYLLWVSFATLLNAAIVLLN